MAAGVVELVADGGGAGDGGEGSGEGRVEDGVGLVVALVAGLALDPYDVASGVNDHVLVRCRASDSYSHEVLSTPFFRGFLMGCVRKLTRLQEHLTKKKYYVIALCFIICDGIKISIMITS